MQVVVREGDSGHTKWSAQSGQQPQSKRRPVSVSCCAVSVADEQWGVATIGLPTLHCPHYCPPPTAHLQAAACCRGGSR